MRMSQALSVAAICLTLTAPMPVQAKHHEPSEAADSKLLEAVAGDWRSDKNKARDAYRHPVKSLTFWGLEPGMTILEVQPGSAAWWTEILAPYAARTGGKLYVTGADLDNPGLPERAREARSEFAARFDANPDLFGKVTILNWGATSAPLPKNTFDFILTARSVHGWMRSPGRVEKNFNDFYQSLKPGGILAVEQHRANPGSQDPQAKSGYVTEDFVIEQARKAGFELAGRSEINANPKDTKDYPFGVWTLPPALRSTAYGSGMDADPNFDHSKYIAIGESDRMTLKFVKPE